MDGTTVAVTGAPGVLPPPTPSFRVGITSNLTTGHFEETTTSTTTNGERCLFPCHSRTCDDFFREEDYYDCGSLEDTYGCDCAGCACTTTTTTTTTLDPCRGCRSCLNLNIDYCHGTAQYDTAAECNSQNGGTYKFVWCGTGHYTTTTETTTTTTTTSTTTTSTSTTTSSTTSPLVTTTTTDPTVPSSPSTLAGYTTPFPSTDITLDAATTTTTTAPTTTTTTTLPVLTARTNAATTTRMPDSTPTQTSWTTTAIVTASTLHTESETTASTTPPRVISPAGSDACDIVRASLPGAEVCFGGQTGACDFALYSSSAALSCSSSCSAAGLACVRAWSASEPFSGCFGASSLVQCSDVGSSFVCRCQRNVEPTTEGKDSIGALGTPPTTSPTVTAAPGLSPTMLAVICACVIAVLLGGVAIVYCFARPRQKPQHTRPKAIALTTLTSVSGGPRPKTTFTHDGGVNTASPESRNVTAAPVRTQTILIE